MTTGIALALLDNESCDLVGSAHPTYQCERMAASVADKIRSYSTVPELICGFASWFYAHVAGDKFHGLGAGPIVCSCTIGISAIHGGQAAPQRPQRD